VKKPFTIHNLSLKLIVSIGVVLFGSLFVWSHLTISFQEKKLIENKIAEMDKFCNTALHFTWFAMLHNPSEDLHGVLKSMSENNDIESIKIFNRHGEIKFSNRTEEIGSMAKKTDDACKVCHNVDRPLLNMTPEKRSRFFESASGEKLLGMVHPILNTPNCTTAECHYHPQTIKKLGALDIVVSLSEIQNKINLSRKMASWTGIYLFIVLGLTVICAIFVLVTRPIKKLINKTNLIAGGNFDAHDIDIHQKDEIGSLSSAIMEMGQKITSKQKELNRQKRIYRQLFNEVPCTITVQNKDFELLEFNKEFSRKFHPQYGEHCYAAYKNLDKKCANCPVEKTFEDGQSHFSEESGINKDGSEAHWFVKTAPLRDETGKVVAAMEMSIDISRRKKLEEKAKDSEKKYQAIFQSIPSPVFILDTDTYEILDCNDAARSVYAYEKGKLKGNCFSILFPDHKAFDQFCQKIHIPFHERLINLTQKKEALFVNIWVRSAEFFGQQVYLVTVINITASVETQQQLIQAGKMATLGEMATGVAHELNQPLSVIKTASSFISKKIKNNEPISPDILATLSAEMESHVDRASKITNHMRLFGRKSNLSKEAVNINDTLKRAFDIFSQQLKLRGIDVIWSLEEHLPLIFADPLKLEQVFINLLINARDAIVKRAEAETIKKEIHIQTQHADQNVTVTISDTGTGIPKQIRDKIFEPFFTTKDIGKGTGLGLSITYGIIKESNGNISVTNNESGGATFKLTFQIKKED
jgi:histidine kinase